MKNFFKKLGAWVWQILIAFDQLINAIFGGMADETLSSRVYRAEKKDRLYGVIFRPLIDWIFFWDKYHCMNSYISEVKRRHFPKEFQEL
jgi:hypothetical protein